MPTPVRPLETHGRASVEDGRAPANPFVLADVTAPLDADTVACRITRVRCTVALADVVEGVGAVAEVCAGDDAGGCETVAGGGDVSTGAGAT